MTLSEWKQRFLPFVVKDFVEVIESVMRTENGLDIRALRDLIKQEHSIISRQLFYLTFRYFVVGEDDRTLIYNIILDILEHKQVTPSLAEKHKVTLSYVYQIATVLDSYHDDVQIYDSSLLIELNHLIEIYKKKYGKASEIIDLIQNPSRTDILTKIRERYKPHEQLNYDNLNTDPELKLIHVKLKDRHVLLNKLKILTSHYKEINLREMRRLFFLMLKIKELPYIGNFEEEPD